MKYFFKLIEGLVHLYIGLIGVGDEDNPIRLLENGTEEAAFTFAYIYGVKAYTENGTVKVEVKLYAYFFATDVQPARVYYPKYSLSMFRNVLKAQKYIKYMHPTDTKGTISDTYAPENYLKYIKNIINKT